MGALKKRQLEPLKNYVNTFSGSHLMKLFISFSISVCLNNGVHTYRAKYWALSEIRKMKTEKVSWQLFICLCPLSQVFNDIKWYLKDQKFLHPNAPIKYKNITGYIKNRIRRGACIIVSKGNLRFKYVHKE